MALRANVTYRGTVLPDAVFRVGTVTLLCASDGLSGTMIFPVQTWLSEAAYLAEAEPNMVPEWQRNDCPWDPEGAGPVVQAYAYVAAKLAAADAISIETI